MIEWKDLEKDYGWILDIERAKKLRKECTIDFKAIANKSWGNIVGYVIDFETFGEYSRRYS